MMGTSANPSQGKVEHSEATPTLEYVTGIMPKGNPENSILINKVSHMLIP